MSQGTFPPSSKKCGLLHGFKIIRGWPISAASRRKYGPVARVTTQVSEFGESPLLNLYIPILNPRFNNNSSWPAKPGLQWPVYHISYKHCKKNKTSELIYEITLSSLGCREGVVIRENDLCVFFLVEIALLYWDLSRNMDCFENGTLSVIFMINYEVVSSKF